MQDNLSPQQSLALIQSMIVKAKSDLNQNRIYFLLWGWITFTAILVQFFLKVAMNYPQHYLVWLITIPAVIITIFYAKKQQKEDHHRTYIGDSMGFLWMGIGISFFILVFIISNSIGWLHAWPFMILMYGLGTFVSGKILQFRPLVVGGIINWVLACACTFFTYDYQILFAAAAILTSYIIPGHLLRNNNK
ncbi:MAG: hypothetical protein H0V30_14400 [Chitinophagaceae bacterium]|jgi:hypothetical protein|nr:hypothetical protein [Chitinophagaceae bacterium]